MSGFASPHAGWVSLIDEDGDECFALAAECGGVDCQVAVDRRDRAQPVIRLVAQRPGELRLRLHNPSDLTGTYFLLRRLEDSRARASEVTSNDGVIVNDFNLLGPLKSASIERDMSTESAMLVEAVRAADGGTVWEGDVEAADRTPRTRFSLSVAPTVGQCKWDSRYWSPKRWVAARAPEGPRAAAKFWVRVWVVPSGRVVLVPARPGHTVAQFKGALARKLNGPCPAEYLRLFFRDEDPLRDDATLDACHVHHESDLHVVVAAEAGRRATQGRLMTCRVRVFDGDKVLDLLLALRARSTVLDLKEAALEHLPALEEGDAIRALRVGLPTPLLDEWLVTEVVDDDSRVHLVVSRPGSHSRGLVRVLVSTVSSPRPLALLLPRCSLVADVKRRVQAEEGFPVHLQRLLFAGEALPNHLRLFDCGVVRDSPLQVVFNLGGGGSALPRGAEPVEAVETTPAKDGNEQKDSAGDPDAGLVVAKVVAGERRPPPSTRVCKVAVLRALAAPLILLEVSLAVSEQDAPPKKKSKRV